MKFYLQHDVVNNKRFLSETDTLGSGSIFSSIAGTTTDYTLDFRTGKVLRSDFAKIHMFFAVTGTVAITPVAMISIPRYIEGQVTPIWEETPLSPDEIQTRNTYVGDVGVTLDWDFRINSNYPLEENKVVLRIHVQDTRADPDNASSITIDKQSYIEMRLSDGETQSIPVHTNTKFSLFQRTERIFLWSNTNAKEGIDIPVYSNVHNKEQILLNVYSRTNVKENIHFSLGSNVQTHSAFVDSLPHVRDIEIGDYVVPTWALSESQIFRMRKKASLYDAVEEIGVDYKIVEPPAPTVVTLQETVLSNAAEKIFEIFEMLKSLDDRTTPGDFFKVFFPGALSGGTVVFRDGEWQLPDAFGTGSYWVPFKIQPTNLLRSVDSGGSLWFCLRQRLVGANVNAYYREVAGTLVLRKRVNSAEEVRVWMWDTASSPFEVNLYASNPVLQNPGFAGQSACLLLG